MKKYSLFLVFIFLVSVGSSFQQAVAQEKTKEEQEKEMKIQKAIDEQKKAMADQKKFQIESDQSLIEKKTEMENAMKNVKVIVEGDGEGRTIDVNSRFIPRGDRSFVYDELSGSSGFSGQDMRTFYGHSMNGDSERTTWDFSRAVKENTFSKDYPFDVEKSSKNVVMSVMGDCKSGEIRIKIIMPNGKSYSDIVIDESGNLNWRKSFSISDTENQDKMGEWKFQVSSTKATGFFKISLQTN
jgi:hypothetical protein